VDIAHRHHPFDSAPSPLTDLIASGSHRDNGEGCGQGNEDSKSVRRQNQALRSDVSVRETSSRV